MCSIPKQFPERKKEWIISDVDYHVALEFFHFEARPYVEPPAMSATELFAIKKKLDADRLEERKKQGEYMAILKDVVR